MNLKMPAEYTDEFMEQLTLGEMQKLFKNDPNFYNVFAEYHNKKSPGTPNFLELFATIVMSFGIVLTKGKKTYGFSDEAIQAAKTLDIERSLLRSGWLVSPYLLNNINDNFFVNHPISLFSNSQSINSIMCQIFYDDKLFHLSKMVKTWEMNPLFSKRMNLFNDSVELYKFCLNKESKLAVYNFLIPFLISQIDGIKNDYLYERGYKFKNGKLQHNNKRIKDWELLNILIKDEKKENDTYYFFVMVSEILFGSTYPKDIFTIDTKKESTRYVFDSELENIFTKLNRHKIMHGEDIEYGSKENLLKVYLILDFMNNTLK